jgi:hypothetical protein
MPACFHTSEAYYTTLYHELVHASGHRSRLNRKTLTDLCLFGDPTYAKEELVAEMGASYLCGVCGIANVTLANSAAYLQSWMQVLRHDPTMLVHAAAQAQKAADYIQNLSPDTGPVRESDDHTPRRRAPTASPPRPVGSSARPTGHDSPPSLTREVATMATLHDRTPDRKAAALRYDAPDGDLDGIATRG